MERVPYIPYMPDHALPFSKACSRRFNKRILFWRLRKWANSARKAMLKRKKVKPITLRDVTIIDDGKLRKAITAASLGNAMEWFDFGVYGFVAYALGKVFFPGADPSVQMVAALATFSVPFLIRPLGGLFFGMLGDKYGRQKILAITIVIMSISTFCIGLIPSYDTIGIWAPILLLICKMAQGFSVGGEYTGASIFVAEYSPDRKRVNFDHCRRSELPRLGLAYSVLYRSAVRDYRALPAPCAGRDSGVPAACR